jgi:polysaccharide deacetylase 2 family uncharacterized protein YibQ
MIRKQFQRLVEFARAHGTGLAIGHPYPQTLSVLRNVLLKPSYYGVELVPVRELIARRARALQVTSKRASSNIDDRPRYARNTLIGN